MSKQLLIAVDDSDVSSEAVTYALDEWPEATVTLVHVVDPSGTVASGGGAGIPGTLDGPESAGRERGERLMSETAETIQNPVDTRLEFGSPASVITNLAETGRHDHIIMGSHGRTGISRIVLGSVAEGVVRRSPVPVTVVR
jgi:Universal stress protein UspA and related nucleotide-binding proteins